ncbi:hypothetical protein K9M74_05080 [Candidatus Woesearchaeota archaeon]|nr:hypothetical protein [Candidatus Woesearchaeota archaeon]
MIEKFNSTNPLVNIVQASDAIISVSGIRTPSKGVLRGDMTAYALVYQDGDMEISKVITTHFTDDAPLVNDAIAHIPKKQMRKGALPQAPARSIESISTSYKIFIQGTAVFQGNAFEAKIQPPDYLLATLTNAYSRLVGRKSFEEQN